MKTHKLSGPAIFMYSVIVLTIIMSSVCFALHYSGVFANGVVLWSGIVSFMILYHFGLRIFMGNVTKLFKLNCDRKWCRQMPFEKRLYKLLGVKKWKNKVLTFNPESFDLKNRSLEEIAVTMTKSELDHWINEGISVISIFFTFIWGCFPAFFISAVAAMAFDAQFIVVQMYNRPIVLRLIEKRRTKEKQPVGLG